MSAKSKFVLTCPNIGTQSVHELFFVIGVSVELFAIMICLSVGGCDVQQERNCEFMNVYTMLHW